MVPGRSFYAGGIALDPLGNAVLYCDSYTILEDLMDVVNLYYPRLLWFNGRQWRGRGDF
jgi:hypothetical protein